MFLRSAFLGCFVMAHIMGCTPLRQGNLRQEFHSACGALYGDGGS